MKLIIGKEYVYDKNNIHGNKSENSPSICTFIGTRKVQDNTIVFVFEDTINKKQFLVEDLDLICDVGNTTICRFDNTVPPIYLSDIEKLRILIDKLSMIGIPEEILKDLFFLRNKLCYYITITNYANSYEQLQKEYEMLLKKIELCSEKWDDNDI